ncbi:MAG: hypothetical protein JG764_989 [Clostridiales bacterium]|jgi:hypothetical protein|nr:hypothetical protein [Clostridiales bacterium]
MSNKEYFLKSFKKFYFKYEFTITYLIILVGTVFILISDLFR